MLWTIFTLSCIFSGSYAGETTSKACYGQSFFFPREFSPPLFKRMFFLPNSFGYRRIVVENGEAKDPRFKVHDSSLYLERVTQIDEGRYTLYINEGLPQDALTLKVRECNDEVRMSYGTYYGVDIPSKTLVLEFFPLANPNKPRILWNRTDLQYNKGGRGYVRRNRLTLSGLTQEDSGSYYYRGPENTLLSKTKVIVTEFRKKYVVNTNSLVFDYDLPFSLLTMTFLSEMTEENVTLIRNGQWLGQYNSSLPTLFNRVSQEDGIVKIQDMESSDSGIYEFRDKNGNLALYADVHVFDIHAPPHYYFIVLGVVILGGVCCCCCVKKTCCKKKTSAAPVVYQHDAHQPAVQNYPAAPPAYHQSYQPVQPASTGYMSPAAPTPPFSRMQVRAPEVPQVPQVPREPLSSGYSCLSSDSQPTFELKGLTGPSAPPLSSYSTTSDVYTSDKLNFL